VKDDDSEMRFAVARGGHPNKKGLKHLKLRFFPTGAGIVDRPQSESRPQNDKFDFFGSLLRVVRNAMTKKMSKVEKRVTEMVRRRMKESRSTDLLGFDVESVHEGRAIFRLDVRPRHKQVHGVVHGGILAALADTTAAIAAYTAVPKGTEIATVELKINYLEPVPGGRIKADARVLRAGRNFVVAECEIFNEDGSLAAKALLTFGAAAGHSIDR
jgi:uncharacterized protein (TIGR00369 family)